MNALFEEAILTAPELYSWEYKKFKSHELPAQISINFAKKMEQKVLEHQRVQACQQS